MDFVNTILGFAVLSGPLWLVALVFLVSIVVVVLVARRFKGMGRRVVAVLAVFLFAFLALFGDEIVGRMYFEHLCETEAGVKVYQTVELPAEYWDERGKARFITKDRSLEFDQSMLGGRYSRRNSLHSDSNYLRIDRQSYQLYDEESDSIIGENVDFMFWGGWLRANFSINNVAARCNREKSGYFTDVLKAAFRSND